VAVRVKLRIRARDSGRDVETIALVNSGFKTTTPQLLTPRRLAEELGIWPDMAPEARIATYGTAGGLVRIAFYIWDIKGPLKPTVYDIASTVLNLLGLPVPSYMDGKALMA